MNRYCVVYCVALLLTGCSAATDEQLVTSQAPDSPHSDTNSLLLQANAVDEFSLDLVRIGPGTFTMGAPSGESDAIFDPADTDPHEVEITYAFEIGTTEVTREQFAHFVDATGYVTTAERDGNGRGWDAKTHERGRDAQYSWRNPGFNQTASHPVTNVTWHDADAFCRWLSNQKNETYRLPTEAEWEFACRSGTYSRYGFEGNRDDIVKYGNVLDRFAFLEFRGVEHTQGWIFEPGSDGFTFTAPVATFSPNSFGIYDMHGNVQEWCRDFYDKNFYARSSRQDPVNEDPELEYRVLRGGNCLDPASKARCAHRGYSGPDFSRFDIGFRVVKELTQ